MAKTGADYGVDLLWTLVASCIATYFMILSYSRYTLVTGETALQAFRKHIHPAVGIFFIVALTSGVAGSVMGVMGIVADISSVWSQSFIEGGISPVFFAAFFSALVFIIFWNGETQFFERALAVMVAVMGVCFLINFFIMTPPLTEFIAGLIPSLPDVPEGQDKSPYIVIASMVGTTVSSALFIVRTTLVKEAGWKIGDWHIQRRDAIVGSFAVAIFAFGIIAAGVSSQFPNVLLLPWLLCDYNQSERNMKLPKYRLMVFAISLLGLVVPIFNARPVYVMIVSQALNSIILPLTVGCILYLGNKESLMGKNKLSRLTNAILFLVLGFAVFTSYLSINGILASL